VLVTLRVTPPHAEREEYREVIPRSILRIGASTIVACRSANKALVHASNHDDTYGSADAQGHRGKPVTS